MERYINEEYYISSYLGKTPPDKINNLIIEASQKIRRYTFNRATSDIEEVKRCCCKLIDKINEYNKLKELIKTRKYKKSETVGKLSVTYSDTRNSKELEEDLEKECFEIIKYYLSNVSDKNGVNLLYRGNC